MKKILMLLAVVALCTSCRESLEERAEREAKTYTEKTCPVNTDAITTLDSLVFHKTDKTFVYYYTIDDQSQQITVFPDKKQAQAVHIERIKNDTKLNIYKEASYAFTHIYRSKAVPDSILFETTITSKDYR